MRSRSALSSAGLDLEDPDDMPALGLEPGTPAPVFELDSIDGVRVSLDDLREPGNPVLLLFTSPTCGPCSVLMATIAEWQREHDGELTVALLSDGDLDAIRVEAEEHETRERTRRHGSHETYEAYEANGTPSAVLVGDDGTGRDLARRREASGIEAVMQQALAGAGRTPGLPVGAPSFPTCARRHSRERRSGSPRSSSASPSSSSGIPDAGSAGRCTRISLAWEANPPEGAPAARRGSRAANL